MKKIILAATILGLLGTQVQTAKAGGCGWPIAAGVFGGLAVGTAIGASVAHPVYYSAAPAYYYPPTTYYQPAPAVTYQAAPPVVYAQPAPTVVYAQPGYVAAPVVTFGFGFGRPYWGDYRGYGWHSYYHGGHDRH